MERRSERYSIVVLGDFNPAIFHPQWFHSQGLLTDAELETASVTVCSKQITIFTTDEFDISVDSSRLGVTTREDPMGPSLRDLVSDILGILEHTPVTAAGFNFDTIFTAPSKEAFIGLRDRILPTASWKDMLEEPGMLDVTIQGRRSDGCSDRIRIHVSPRENHGVMVAVNQHYELDDGANGEVGRSLADLRSILREEWVSFERFAREASNKTVASGGEVTQ